MERSHEIYVKESLSTYVNDSKWRNNWIETILLKETIKTTLTFKTLITTECSEVTNQENKQLIRY